MRLPFATIAFLAWVPAVLILFRALGPGRAAAVAVLGGHLFLPPGGAFPPPYNIAGSNKHTMTGLAIVLGVLLTDPRALWRARPRWADLPMAVFVASPLLASASHGFRRWPAAAEQAWQNAAIWAVPYLAGRLYFGDEDGPRRLSVAVVVAGLLYVPICAFEAALGPEWYLVRLVYGIPPVDVTAWRLGGWRPQGFLNQGLELATWMALTTVLACWLWLGRPSWRPWRLPSWSPALALGATAVASRGVYGYAILAIGVPAALLTRALATRAILVMLLLVPPSYMAVRISGAWDGRELMKLARRAGKEGTVAVRMEAEARQAREALAGAPILGEGGRYYDAWSDAWWPMVLRQGGLVGLSSYLAAFLLVPVGLAVARLRPGSRPGAVDSPAWGPALFVILHAIDALQNTSVFPPVTLLGGSLVGAALARAPAAKPAPRAGARDRVAAALTVILALALVAALEVVGNLPRTPWSPD
jgi:hypothetical protein